jgi:PTS system ascorbate-specific IIA component
LIGVLLVTHGTLGEALLAAASHALGAHPPRVAALGIGGSDDPERTLARLREALASLDDGSGVIVLADIFGATPANLVARLLQAGRIEAVAGVNLPMLLRVLSYREAPLAAAVGKALSGGAEGVLHVNSDPCNGKR